MEAKFKGVPTDEDTKIVFQAEAGFGSYRTLYQKWFWDGIEGESLIFDEGDVGQLSDEELESLVRESPMVKSQELTVKRNRSGYAFINFNFVAV